MHKRSTFKKRKKWFDALKKQIKALFVAVAPQFALTLMIKSFSNIIWCFSEQPSLVWRIREVLGVRFRDLRVLIRSCMYKLTMVKTFTKILKGCLSISEFAYVYHLKNWLFYKSKIGFSLFIDHLQVCLVNVYIVYTLSFWHFWFEVWSISKFKGHFSLTLCDVHRKER